MSNLKNNISRRRFLATAGATALSSVLLKGCLGNPPEDTPTVTSANATKINRFGWI